MGESHLKFFVRLPVHRGLNKQRENIKQTTLSAFVIAPHAQQIEDPQMCNMNFVWVWSWNHPSASILPYFEANKIVWMFKIELFIKEGQKNVQTKRTIKCPENLQLSLQIWRQIKKWSTWWKQTNLHQHQKGKIWQQQRERDNFAPISQKGQFGVKNTNRRLAMTYGLFDTKHPRMNLLKASTISTQWHC